MSGYVVHTATGLARSISTTVPGNLPNGWTYTTITDSDYQSLVSGAGMWDSTTKTVIPKPPDPEANVIRFPSGQRAFVTADQGVAVVDGAETRKIEDVRPTLSRRATTGVATVTIPVTLSIGTGKDVGPFTVTLDRELPDTSYNAVPTLSGLPDGLLVNCHPKVTQKTTTTVNVTIRVTAIISTQVPDVTISVIVVPRPS